MFKKKSISIFGLLAKESPKIFVIALILGLVSGLAFALIFPIVQHSFSSQTTLAADGATMIKNKLSDYPISTLSGIFFINCVVIYLTRAISNIGNNYLAQRASVKVRKNIYNAIDGAGVADLEKVGSAKITSVINIDVTSVVHGALTIPGILSSLVTTAGLLGYIAYINLKVFYFVITFIFFGVISYQLIVNMATKYIKKSRDVFDLVQEGVKALVYGAKELKINSKNKIFHHEKILQKNENIALENYLIGSSILYLASGYGELLIFILIGVAAFYLSHVYSIGINDQIGIVMSLLYISGPIGILLNSMPLIARGEVALQKIREVVDALKQEEINKEHLRPINWESLKLKSVSYAHSNDNGESFKIENITFEVKKGEVVYLLGGNGSGKSTLAKVISMYYMPIKGEISLGDTLICPNNIETGRQSIGAIFSDFYLFSSIYGYKKEQKETSDEYLKILDLDHKVSISDEGEFSTLLLSDGQKKRLALLSVLLEDKEIYVFDEWASDQDPHYKKIFYEVILPSLKFKNKAVVVVTHDDAYFHNADKLVHMDYGRIKSIENKKAPN